MKTLLVLIALSSASAFAGDSLFIHGMTCNLFVNHKGQKLINTSDLGDRTYRVSYGRDVAFLDSKNNKWTISLRATPIHAGEDSEYYREASNGVIIQRSSLSRFVLTIELSTDALSPRPLRSGAYSGTDTLRVTAQGTANSRIVGGSFGGGGWIESATAIDCQIESRDAVF